jgi:putative ABC transport system substrate-binding protein
MGGHGWVEGQNLVLEFRDPDPAAADSLAAYTPLVQELIQLPVDVLLTGSYVSSLATIQLTQQVPIVAAPGGDMVATGLVPNVAHPGSNVTGYVNFTGPTAIAKQFEILTEMAPSIARVAYLHNGEVPTTASSVAAAQDAANRLGRHLKYFDVRTADDVDAAFAAAAAWPADGVLIGGALTPLAYQKNRVGQLARQYRLLTMATVPPGFAPGELGYYASSSFLNSEQADTEARQVDAILSGTKPGDIPVAMATRFDLVLSRSALQDLGLSLSEDVARQVTQWTD